MTIKIIRNEEGYDAALARAAKLIDELGGDEQSDELELLALVIEKYEAEQHPIDAPDPIAAIRHYMDRRGIKNDGALAEAVELTSGRISELLNRRRHLTLDHIRRFQKIGVPVEALVAEYELDRPGGLRNSKSEE